VRFLALRPLVTAIGQMNASLDRQINMAFDVSVVILADNKSKRVTVTN
jgi:hypothetical protein